MFSDDGFLKILSNENGLLTIGLNNNAEDALGEIKFIDLSPVGTALSKDDMFGSIEAKKAVIELESPDDGEIFEINEKIEDNPELLYEEKEDNWIIKLKLR